MCGVYISLSSWSSVRAGFICVPRYAILFRIKINAVFGVVVERQQWPQRNADADVI